MKQQIDEHKLPYPPTVNHYWGRRGNRTFLTDRAKAYRNTVAAMLYGIKPKEGTIRLHVDVYPPDLRRRDIDNLCKSLLDSLQHAGAYLDDFQIGDLRLIRRTVRKNGEVIVTLQEYNS